MHTNLLYTSNEWLKTKLCEGVCPDFKLKILEFLSKSDCCKLDIMGIFEGLT